MIIKDGDYKLLENEKYQLFMFYKELQSKTFTGYTDRKNFIIGNSSYLMNTIWIWNTDFCSDDILDRALDVLDDYYSYIDDCFFICKHKLSNYYTENKNRYEIQANKVGSLAFMICKNLKHPLVSAPGKLVLCTLDDIDTIRDLIKASKSDCPECPFINEDDLTDDEIRLLIYGKRAFFYKDLQGIITSFCLISVQGDDDIFINCYYTYPEYRDQHYDLVMMYELTNSLKNAGLNPILPIFSPSNHHVDYEEIGYVETDDLDVWKRIKK